tara:strand:- start:4309 stop:4992 length:684 start_codon:yes stop_codon:yes gene_type:complete
MYHYIFKLIVVGNNNVGKSSIVKSFTNHDFRKEYHSTIGIDFSSKIIQLKRRKRDNDNITDIENQFPVKLQIWDTAGSERFTSIVRNYYRNCLGIFIVFDVTDRKSFNKVQSWYEDVITYSNKEIHELSIVLIGNKSDLEIKRVVSYEEAIELASHLKIHYIEVSAKYNINIPDMFQYVSNDLFSKIENHQIQLDDSIKPNMKFLELKEQPSVSHFRKLTGNCCVIS